MTVKKKRIGRPPAQWVQELEKITLPESQWLDLNEIALEAKTSVLALKAFFRKCQTPKKHVVDQWTTKTIYKVKDIKKTAKDYLRSWSNTEV